MITVYYDNDFKKSLKKRIEPSPALKGAFLSRLEVFRTHPQDPILRCHKLTGALKGMEAFSITGDVRVIYRRQGDNAYFLDIGTHNQVY